MRELEGFERGIGKHSMPCAGGEQYPDGRIEQRGLDIGRERLTGVDRDIPCRKREMFEALKGVVRERIMITPEIVGDVNFAERRQIFRKKQIGEDQGRDGYEGRG